jgi:hypothetical protein
MHKNSIAELSKRLETLPKDLNKISTEMWLRLNENESIYRQDAAFFLQLALDHAKFSQSLFAPPSIPLNSTHVLLAYHSEMTDILLKECTAVHPAHFIKEHRAIVEQIEIRCAGLLEVSSVNDTVSFIHRSAIGFLGNTPDGIQILQHERRKPETRFFIWPKACIISLEYLCVCPSFKNLSSGRRTAARWISH